MGERERMPSYYGPNWSRAKTGFVLIVMILIIFSIVFALTMVVGVGVGHAVILVDPVSGSVSDPILGPSYAVKAPWVTAVDISCYGLI